MTSLRDSAILAARVAHEHLMVSSATIMRRTQVADTSGGFTDSYTAAGTYDCTFTRIPINPLERESNPRVYTIAAWIFRFPSGTDIRSTDQIVVGSRTFEVVQSGAGTVEITRQAICQEIT